MSKSYDSIHMMNHCVLDLPGLEGAGTVLHDRSKYRNNGTFGAGATAPTWTQLASGNWTLGFDGNDFISGIDTGMPIGINNRTVVAWVKRGATTSVDRIVSWGTWSADNAFDCGVGIGTISLIGHTNNYTSSGTPITQDVWILVGWVLNSGRVYFSANGVVDSDFATTINTTSSGISYIGCSIQGPGVNPLVGSLALPRIWNIALTAGQVKTLYDKERILFGV